jgi:hypothetical protein
MTVENAAAMIGLGGWSTASLALSHPCRQVLNLRRWPMLIPSEHRGTSVDRVLASLLPEFVPQMRAAHTAVVTYTTSVP